MKHTKISLLIEMSMWGLIALGLVCSLSSCSSNSNLTPNYIVYNTGLVNSGSITIAPNGCTVIAGNTDNTHGLVMTSCDEINWQVQQQFYQFGRNMYLLSMVTVEQAIYLTFESEGYTTDSQYQTDIYKSLDNGNTWNKVANTTQYLVMWSHVVNGTKIAVSLWNVPQVGYQYGYVDFGWYDISTETLQIVTRLASTNDLNDNNFPSETYIYQNNNILTAVVRWGESPQIPFSRLKTSSDSGNTWTDTEIIWQGLAGNMFGCQDAKGDYWFAGYQEDSRSNVLSSIWNAVPTTGITYGFQYPITNPIYGTKGNGGIACKGNEIQALVGNGTMQFVRFNN